MRDKKVDFIKGIAILLMVMGHFLAAANGHLDGGNPNNGWLVGQWIYSFHMPLFFFLTGYLSKTAPVSMHDLLRKIIRKAQTLLLPGLSFMLIGYVINGSWSMAWFLKVLFQLTVVFAIIRFIATKREWSKSCELIVHLIFFVIWFVSSHFLKGTWVGDHLWIHGAAARYPYIVLGYIVATYDWSKLKISHTWVYTITLITYILSYYLSYYELSGTISSYIKEYVVAPAAILSIFIVSDNINYETKSSLIFCSLGQKTLAIYLLSSYFLVSMPQLADWWIMQDNITSIMVQLITSLMWSIICISICCTLEWIIRKSDLLNLLLLGKSMPSKQVYLNTEK